MQIMPLEQTESNTSLRNVSNEELMVRVAKKRCNRAYCELYERNASKVTAYLVQYGASRIRAEELTQDAFLVVWQRSDKFDGCRSRFLTWLCAIARNKCIDDFRRYRSVSDLQKASWAQPVAIADPEQQVETRQKVQVVQHALPALSNLQRETIEGAYYLNKSMRTLANEAGVPLGTMKSRVRIAVETLRLCVMPRLAA